MGQTESVRDEGRKRREQTSPIATLVARRSEASREKSAKEIQSFVESEMGTLGPQKTRGKVKVD